MCDDFINNQFKIFSNFHCNKFFELWVFPKSNFLIAKYLAIKISFYSEFLSEFYCDQRNIHNFNPLVFVETFMAQNIANFG